MAEPERRTRSTIRITLIVAASLAIGATSVNAAITGTTTYDVEGRQLSEVWQAIERNGPDGEHAGLADTKLGANLVPGISCGTVPDSACAPDGTRHVCQATLDASYAVSTHITLPKWIGFDDACDEAKTEWNRFLAALTAHEHGHDVVVQSALDAAEPKTRFAGESFSDCSETAARRAAQAAASGLRAALDKETERLEDIMAQANRDYDARTDHGATEGAELDTSIVCHYPKTPPELIALMVSELDFLDHAGLRNALQAKLRNALNAIEQGNTQEAKGQLNAFIHQVRAQRGKKLSIDEADQFIERALVARDAL